MLEKIELTAEKKLEIAEITIKALKDERSIMQKTHQTSIAWYRKRINELEDIIRDNITIKEPS